MKALSQIVVVVGLALVGCGDSGREPIDVSANTLGVSSLEASLVIEDGQELFELRGFSNTHSEIASVRVRRGYFIDEEHHADSEIVFDVAGTQSRYTTRAFDLLRVTPPDDAATQAFLDIPEVTAVLGRDARLQIDTANSGESPYYCTGTPYCDAWTGTCNEYDLNTSPLARQCCYTEPQDLSIEPYTIFVADVNMDTFDDIVRRYQNPQYTGCRAYDGVSTCSGTGCYYGPNGYATPGVTFGNSTNRYGRIRAGIVGCNGTLNTAPSTPTFSNVTGTFARGQGCCVNGAGPCANTTACNACGGGGAAGRGFWDY